MGSGIVSFFSESRIIYESIYNREYVCLSVCDPLGEL